ncbi:MAG: carboxypeptidase-like regulatory domain-containing protein [Lentimicrobium sp.]|nr:carboxypeptidase-like regulatory domain-containing protein [Lentimicrobium sp.]
MKNILKISAIAFFALVLNTLSFAEGNNTTTPPSSATAALTGKVLDNITGETLAGVAVAIEGTELQVYTDLDGNFSISGIEPGTYNLVLSMISYKNSLVENVQLEANDKEVLDIKLDNK